MSKFIKTALSNFSNLFQTNDNNTTINTSEYTIPPMQQENNENINNNDTIDFDSLLESTENITATDDKDSNNSDESKSITPEEVGATTAVFATSVLSGVAKIYEYIDDGVTWAGGKVVEGASWLVGESAGLFSEDKKNSIMNRRKDIKENVKNEIDRDKVGELNEWFYENTKIGQDINEASYLKYDSEAAKTTQNITTKIGEIGGATALTILTGGAAAPLVFSVGCAEGIGKTAEKTYQNGGDFDDGTFSILLSGGLNGLSWYANGKLGQGAYEIFNTAKIVGLKSTATDLLSQVGNKEFIIDTLKNGLNPLKTNLTGKTVLNVNALMNYGSSAMAVAGDFAEVLNSEEGFTAENIAKLTAEYFGYLGLNIIEDTGRDFISGYTISEQQAQKFAQQIASNNSKVTLNDLNKFTDASKTKVLNSMDTHDLALQIQDLSADDIRKLSRSSSFNKKLIEVYCKEYSQNISMEQYYQQLGFSVERASGKLDLSQIIGDSKLYLNSIYNKLKFPNRDAYDEITKQMQQEFGNYYNKSGNIDTNKFYEILSPYMDSASREKFMSLNNDVADSFESTLTKAQKDAIFNYTGYGGFQINTYLNDGVIDYGDDMGRVRTRDEFSSIDNIQNFISGHWGNHVYTTTDGSLLEDLDSVISSAMYDNPFVTYRGVGNLFDNGEVVDLNSIKIGSTLHTNSYLSSSILLNNAYLGETTKGINEPVKNICLEIIVPPNSGSGAYIENISGVENFGQTEVLLKRNQTLTVIGKPYKKYMHNEWITFVPVCIE